MIVTDAIVAMRNKIFERVGKHGLVDASEDRLFLKEANRTIWKLAVKLDPKLYETLSGTLTLPPTGLPYSTVDANGVYKVSSVERLVGGTWYPVFPIAGEERFELEPGPSVAGSGLVAYYFHARSESIFFSPIPVVSLSVRVGYVPNLADPADAAELLAGKLKMHHDLVVTHAAQLAFSKDEKASSAWDDDYNRQLALLMADISEDQAMQPRHVRAAGPF